MVADTLTRAKLDELAKRANKIKADPLKRHFPNEQDIKKASENARLLQPSQFQTIQDERVCE